MKLGIWILWPSFLVAAVANAILFALFDPAELNAHGEFLPAGPLAAYTVVFFAFWTIGACSSAFTCFLQSSATEVNRLWCALPNDRRPPGCRTPESS